LACETSLHESVQQTDVSGDTKINTIFLSLSLTHLNTLKSESVCSLPDNDSGRVSALCSVISECVI